MLRSRRTGAFSGRWPKETNVHNAWCLRRRLRIARVRCLCACLVAALMFLGGVIIGMLRSGRGLNSRPGHELRNETRQDALGSYTPPPQDGPKRATKFPLVDREVLRKLERMENFYAPNYYDLPSDNDLDNGPGRSQWLPVILSVPERGSRLGVPLRGKGGRDAPCESREHPLPCRFLLPLRVAEQESKARVHLTQLARLARALNRTLVLPNVGKSRIGACFKWDLETYYNVSSLGEAAGYAAEDSEYRWFIELERFRGWLYGRENVRSQLVSVGAGVPAHTTFRDRPIYSNSDVSAIAYTTFGAWERDLPGCFSSKFEKLAIETTPVYMSAPNTTNKDGSTRPIGDALVDTFSAVSSKAAPRIKQYEPLEIEMRAPTADAQVLVVNWDLRHPVFTPSATAGLQYSRRMHDLADKYAPNSPFLAVQWRMESVDPSVLEECAHSLVDLLSRMLHDPVLSENVSSIWFASDYPYPIGTLGTSDNPSGLIAKSGTFKDFGVHHRQAIDILRGAFSQQGELGNWTLTDFTKTIAMRKDATTELLNDSGVMAILDKLISIKANLFVSGSSRCGRRSSFTKQVVDTRGEHWSRFRPGHLRNVVEIFG